MAPERAGYAAVIPAGGRARRMGADKPALAVGGASMLARVAAALPAGTAPIVVVGRAPGDAAPDVPGVVHVAEEPAGAGPAYAVAAGVLHASTDLTYVLAADLPFLTREATALLASSLRAGDDGAVFVDRDGRPQWLCGLWRTGWLRAETARTRPGDALRAVLGAAMYTEVRWTGPDPAPYFDCDTPGALMRARRLLG